MKRMIALLLALLLLSGLCACKEESDAQFRTLEVIGTKHYGSICRENDKIAPVIAAALETLAGNGTISALTAARLGKDRSCMEGDSGALAALEELPEPRTLFFGVEKEFYPMAYEENGEVRGLFPDLAFAVGELLGWDVRVIGIAPTEVEAQLASGNIDCALGFDTGLVSAGKITVGTCCLESDILLAVRPESEVRKMRDLNGNRVGTISDPAVQKAIRSSEKLTKNASGATEYLSLTRCLEALDKGWCAAVAADELMLAFYRG